MCEMAAMIKPSTHKPAKHTAVFGVRTENANITASQNTTKTKVPINELKLIRGNCRCIYYPYAVSIKF